MSNLRAVCKLRPVADRKPDEQMIVRNVEAMRLMVEAIMTGDEQKEAKAMFEIDKELNEYLAGIKIPFPGVERRGGLEGIGGVI